MNKIALIEDDPGIVEVTKIILEEAGYKVLTIDKPHQIKQLILKELPDLMLMDIWIADQNGADLVKYFKHQTKTKAIPVIMLSAKQDGEDTSKKCGANDFLAKPFDIAELLEKIKKYI